MSKFAPSSWQTIDTAPSDEEILVYTRPWGPIIALYSQEFDEWLPRMQVPVSIKDADEMPTHWQPLPKPPDGIDPLPHPAAAAVADGKGGPPET